MALPVVLKLLLEQVLGDIFTCLSQLLDLWVHRVKVVVLCLLGVYLDNLLFHDRQIVRIYFTLIYDLHVSLTI